MSLDITFPLARASGQPVAALTKVTEAEKARILNAPRTSEAHRGLLAATPALHQIQTGGSADLTELPAAPRVLAWNLERCLFPQASADLVRAQGADVVLLSEMDLGMARTGQRNTTAEMAEALGMTYAYGVEFFEMGLGSPTELEFCTDDFNAQGWHGNAILSKAPLTRVALLRLDDHGHWFASDFGADPLQPRIGGRMALLAEVPTESGPICVVSTHLESNSGPQHRQRQMELIRQAVADFAGDMPVIIGGDLNTGNHCPPDFDWRGEGLFDWMEGQGYRWDATPEGMTTRPSLITRHPDRQMKLDWFAHKGLIGTDIDLIPALDAAGQPLSDHDPIVARFYRD
ncbi:endonuclease/exonuclease/phosphatase family protein [Donghicola mangrovi]|uniref:Endonuclease n=1 Tax=Donghicola mangrovi TaxID=2729614 RepID=A0A850Q906_9RHOB|nr:endonuclease/exonuclease/phosphatase family protein [Donghicola mangrovi]NVO24722.1 endonuclease [Donghicola mangrovi]